MHEKCYLVSSNYMYILLHIHEEFNEQISSNKIHSYVKFCLHCHHYLLIELSYHTFPFWQKILWSRSSHVIHFAEHRLFIQLNQQFITSLYLLITSSRRFTILCSIWFHMFVGYSLGRFQTFVLLIQIPTKLAARSMFF